MMNIYGWSAFRHPAEGKPVRLSNKSQQALIEFNKRQGIWYAQSRREVYLTQSLGNAGEADDNFPMLWTDENDDTVEFWSSKQHLIPSPDKDEFFLKFLWRVPSGIYTFNPETALAAMTNIWLRESLGTEDLRKVKNFTDKYLGFVRGFQSRCFPYLMLSHLSTASHPVLPLEIRVGAYLSLISSYLQTRVNLDSEELPTFPMITKDMMASLGLPLTSTLSSYQAPSAKTTKLMLKQEKRSNHPGFWTDLLCHYRCIICGMLLTENKEGERRTCPEKCLDKGAPVRCSLCDTILVGEDQIVLHYSTLCKRSVGEVCPICLGRPLQGTCQCQASAKTVHCMLRNLIASNQNPLFREDNIQTLSAILLHHHAGNLTYSNVEAKDANYGWWQVDRVKRSDHSYKVTTKDVENVLCCLPVLSVDEKSLIFPGTNLTISVEALLELQAPKPGPVRSSPRSSPSPNALPSWMGGDHPSSEDSTPSMRSSLPLSWDHGAVDPEKLKKIKKNVSGREEGKDTNKREGKMKEERVHKGTSGSDRGGEESDADSDGDGDGGGAGDGGGDDTDDGGEDDDDGEDLPVGRRPLGARGDRHKCRNETHRRPKLFSSSIEKLRHIILKHKCPYSSQNCKFYNEFEYKIQAHVANVHDDTEWFECEVEKCSQKFSTKLLLTHHKEIHPKCVSCLKHFFSAQELKDHHPCLNLHAERFPKKREKGGAYLSNVPTNEIDIFRQGNQDPNIQLADSMAKLCQLIPMDQHTKKSLIENFKKCAALQVAQQNLEKFPSSARKMTRLLIEPPCFEHFQGQKENLGKVSDFLGKDIEMWCPSNSPKSQFKNFLSLSELNQKMVAATAACKLLESSACCLLLQRFSLTAKNAIESRCFSPQATWSYRTILTMSQQLYYFLNLEEVATEAEESRRKEGEHLCEYSSRAYKLLSTAALGRDVEEKEKYIASNLRRLVFRALPPKLRTKIDNLELRFGISYDSKDLLDFYKTEQLEQSHLRGESLADTSLIEPQKVLNVKKERYKDKEESKKEKGEPNKVTKQKDWDKRPKKKSLRIGNLIQESKLGAVGQLHTNAPPSLTPKPPYAAQGMAQGPRDLFSQASRASSKVEYIRKKKAQLGLDEDDRRSFCFRCGASEDSYHTASKCKLPNTEEIHHCGDGLKLFHSPQNCPKKKPLRSIRVKRE